MITAGEILSLCRVVTQGVQLPCHIQPRASKTGISGVYGTALKITLNAPPVDGKANAALCEFVAKKCGMAKSLVSVVSGETSRDKMLLIRGIAPEALAEALVKK